MDRRGFIKSSILAGAALCLHDWEKAFTMGRHDNMVGKPWPGWKEGQFQIHFIYTGVAESIFLIFPDGTTMLLDCGDFDAAARGEKAVPILPGPERHAGEWIARYVTRVNPAVTDVDYMLLTHYHNDHAGSDRFYAEKIIRNGKEYPLSGFAQAAEILSFKKGIDRCWPSYDDPTPDTLSWADKDSVALMQNFYDYMCTKRGLEMEKFRLGATDQIIQLHNPGKYPSFQVRNICANGRIAYPDGRIVDLFKARKAAGKNIKNENAMSLGMVFRYGNFSFFTAGDFNGRFKDPDGTPRFIEDDLAEVCGHANVAKIDHHGRNTMSRKLLSALRSQVYVSCVWDQGHNTPSCMELLSDRSIYPGDRIICPTVMPKERRAKDGDTEWMKDVADSSYEGGHVVVNVEKCGHDYSVSYLTAADESMTVRSVLRFKAK
ncbi:MAG: MBL fold metallo-hydrolase [Bacteroidales bacterium]|nr:MBL fold metallo-hydrolase [Bacteroidales bacterium]